MNDRRQLRRQRNEANGKKIWDVLTPFGVMIICLIAVSIVAIMAASAILKQATGESVLEIGALMDRLPYLSLLVSLGFYIAALLFLRKGYKFDQLRFEQFENRWSPDMIIMAMLLLVCIGHLWSNAIYGMKLTEIFPEYTLNAASSFENQNPLLLILVTVIAGPVVEEIAFRGMVYRRSREYFSKPWAVLISSLLFGIYHLNMVQFVYAIMVGAVCAMLYEASRNILVPILAHMAVNLWALYSDKAQAALEGSTGNGVLILCGAEGALALVLLIVLIKKQKNIK